VGIPAERVLLAEDGDVVEFTEVGGEVAGRLGERVEVGRVFVDGKGVGDVGPVVLRDRRHLSEDGMVIVVMVVDGRTGELMSGPDLITRGFVFEEQSADILEEAKRIVAEIARGNGESGAEEGEQRPVLELEADIRRALKKHFQRAIERRPLILPIVIEM
jgi:ribonuclease J